MVPVSNRISINGYCFEQRIKAHLYSEGYPHYGVPSIIVALSTYSQATDYEVTGMRNTLSGLANQLLSHTDSFIVPWTFRNKWDARVIDVTAYQYIHNSRLSLTYLCVLTKPWVFLSFLPQLSSGSDRRCSIWIP